MKPARALCRKCGTRLDPAATCDWNGQPGVYDVHPGCEPGGTQLRLVVNRKTA